MDGNALCDDGIDALASSFEGGFAPHLQVRNTALGTAAETRKLRWSGSDAGSL